MRKKVAIQGAITSFHEIAARYYFENNNIEILCYDTFREMFAAAKRNEAEYLVMAIENSLAGGILPNYNLLRESNLAIVGEIYLRIRQNLLALKGQKIEDIREVYSHPMAILQCQSYFEQYPKIKLIESLDTAISARDISENNLLNTGAIASIEAAEKFGLEVLEESIETDKMNYTRFWILHRPEEEANIDNSKFSKASISFELVHETGSLYKVLSIFSFYNINLTKIQSLPIIGRDWEYLFYIDVEFDDYAKYRQCIEAVKPLLYSITIIGEYEKGRKIM